MTAGTPDNNDPQDTRSEENDPVWRLLSAAPSPAPDAWFTVRTLARCRHERLETEPDVISLVRMWRWALGGGLGIALALVLLVEQGHFGFTPPDKQKNVQEAFEILASVDSDPDSFSPPTSSSWQDSSF